MHHPAMLRDTTVEFGFVVALKHRTFDGRVFTALVH